MISTLPSSENLYEALLRQSQVKHALKTALACCLATSVSYLFRVPTGQLAPVFAYLLMTMGMPHPRVNWLLAQLAIVASGLVSSLIVVTFHDALFLYLAVTFLWIFTCMLLSSRHPLPASLGAMVSALGLFTFFQGTVGAALSFYVAYALNFLIAGFAVVVVRTLVWRSNARDVFLMRLGGVYALLENYCRYAARRLRSGESLPAENLPDAQWAPFRPLRRLMAPELRREHETRNPFASVIIACRLLNLRLWFFNQAVAPPALGSETREQFAGLLDRCAQQLHDLLDGALARKSVPPVDPALIREVNSTRWDAGRERGAGSRERGERTSGSMLPAPSSEVDVLLARGIHATLLLRFVQDIQLATSSHNRLLASLHKGLAGNWAALQPGDSGARLFDVQSLRAGAKLFLILILLLAEEGWLGFPGGSQVAFFATFFASTGNLGSQNKADLIGLAGLLGGFVYGVVAAFLTTRMPHFPLLLLLVFLGEFLANLTFQKLSRFRAAGVQAGLAIPFAFLATTGPEWGSFSDIRTRFWGLVAAGFTAVVVHAYLWPVLPVRLLWALIAAALRATAESLVQLFGPSRAAWVGAPPSLSDTVTRARDLLDDAQYLPGPERADPAYDRVLACLQEIDANMEYIHFLVALDEEYPLRQRFFQVIGDYAEQARSVLEQVAQQFQPSLRRAALQEPVRWRPDAAGRWESACRDIGPLLDTTLDPLRPAVIARCLDQIAEAVERLSAIACEIRLRTEA